MKNFENFIGFVLLILLGKEIIKEVIKPIYKFTIYTKSGPYPTNNYKIKDDFILFVDRSGRKQKIPMARLTNIVEE